MAASALPESYPQFVYACHREQYRNYRENFVLPAIPYAEHLNGVASILDACLSVGGECSDPQKRRDMLDAALGHDLLEDTAATEEDVLALTNENVLRLIRALTNPCDDAHTDAYMEQLRSASEEARLIKYADLIENTASVSYYLFIVGKEWAGSFYCPILERTAAVLAGTVFTAYPKTADHMRKTLAVFSELLRSRMLQAILSPQ